LRQTRLYEACKVSIQPKRDEQPEPPGGVTVSFIDQVCQLHTEKHNAYGNSWKKRGEMLGILANIARKMDRLETGQDTTDETKLDTAVDTFVYLGKYRVWLSDFHDDPLPFEWAGAPAVLSDFAEPVNEFLQFIADNTPTVALESEQQLIKELTSGFDELEMRVKQDEPFRFLLVDDLLQKAWQLACLRQ
jgi:hypothetical protein